MNKKIGIIIGSLRTNSYNRKVAESLIKLNEENLDLEIVEILELPQYNEDLEAALPQSWAEFRNKIKSLDGVIFVTPEYNRSTSGALKNAIDVASRPWGHNVWNQKAGAVISVSMGPLGGFGANHRIRQMATCVNLPMMQQPEMYVGNVGSLFNEAGELTNTDTEKIFKNFLSAYAQWVEQLTK
ncbi:MAG TPA: NAD(P)H-dependent oxidoreductase [Ferruginibacter sp.]|nr:NAD(P)H-dependent oxidoreductase [Ferruginibacter sp.]HRO17772.1 NAD(P)H-dependent oxidoreductase [Ferruginibacter sp.]